MCRNTRHTHLPHRPYQFFYFVANWLLLIYVGLAVFRCYWDGWSIFGVFF